MSNQYTDIQLYDIAALKQQGYTWADIAKKINKKYGLSKSTNAIRHTYRDYGHMVNVDEVDVNVSVLKAASSSKRRAAKASRSNQKILDHLNAREELLAVIEDTVSKLKYRKPKSVSKRSTKGRKMTMELLLSDIHYGKITESFDLAKCRERVQYLTSVFLQEFTAKSKQFNVERVIVALMGDIVESATMHGLESARSCEFGNSRQVQEAIISIFEDVIVPIASLGVKVHVPAVTGNHDRTDMKKTYNNPGEENLTFIIYKTLEYLSKQAGYKNVTFDIPSAPYALVNIYGNVALYEHYDNAKGNTRKALEALMMKRQNQVKDVISFMRGGHFHESTMFGRGTIIVNGSVPGQDSYANVMGFDSEATQTINFYVETTTRPTSFYSTFPVYLP